MAQIIDATLRLIDKFTPTLNKVNKAIREQEKQNKRLSRSIESRGKSFTNFSNSLAPAALGISAAIAGGVMAFADFEEQVLSVGAKSEATGEQLSVMKNQAVDMSTKYSYSAKEVASGMDAMAAAGWSVNNILQATEPLLQLASGSQADMATSADLLTSTMTAFHKEASQATDVVNKLLVTANASNTGVPEMTESFKYAAPIVSAAGMSFEEMATAIGLMSNQGIKGSQAGTALGGAITRMLAPTASAKEAMEALNLNFVDAEGKFVGMRSVIEQFGNATANMGEAQRVAYAKMLFGQEAVPGMLALVNEGTQKFDELGQQIMDSGGAAERASQMMNQGMGAQLKILRNNVMALGMAFGERMAPYIKRFGEFLKGATDFIRNLNPTVLDVALKFGFFVIALWASTAAIGSFLTSVSSVIVPLGKLATGIQAAGSFSAFVGAKFATFMNVVRPLISLFGNASGALSTLLRGLLSFNPVLLGIVVAVAIVVMAVKRNWDMFANAFTTAWTRISGALDGLVSAISNAFSSMGANTSTFQAILGFIADIVAVVLVNAFENFVSVAVTVIDIVTAGITMAGGVISGVVGVVNALLVGDWAGAWTSAGNVVTSVLDGIKSIISSLIGLVGELISNIANAASNLPVVGGLFNIGNNASGTDNWRGGLTYVHEQGGELMNLPSGTQIIPHDESLKQMYSKGQAASSKGVNVTVNKVAETIVVRDQSDIDAIADKVANHIANKLQVHSVNQAIGAV